MKRKHSTHFDNDIMVLKRKNYSGYSEAITNGTQYINSQVENLGDNTADILDFVDREGLERIENLPVVRDVKPKSISRYRKLIRPISRLLRKKKKENRE